MPDSSDWPRSQSPSLQRRVRHDRRDRMSNAASFRAISHYDWGPADLLPTGTRLDRNPFLPDRVQGGRKQLAARGFAIATSERRSVDSLSATINQRIDVDQLDHEYGYCYDDGCRAGVVEHEAGTLAFDIADTHEQGGLAWVGPGQPEVPA